MIRASRVRVRVTVCIPTPVTIRRGLRRGDRAELGRAGHLVGKCRYLGNGKEREEAGEDVCTAHGGVRMVGEQMKEI